MRKLLLLFSLPILLSTSSLTQDRLIDVNVNQVKGPLNKFFNHTVGSGYAALGLRQTWQDHLKTVSEECGFRYVRFHGIFHDNMRVFDYSINGSSEVYDWRFRRERTGEIPGEKKPVYNWMYVDIVYDAILAAGMKPFVELGFMPEALASGDATVFWWKGNVTPPKSFEAWGALVEAFALHLTEKYGEEEIKTWFFEVWNEPNGGLFWKGNQQDYFNLYKHSANAIKKVNKDYKVGGPSTAGGKWLNDLIVFCAKENLPLDFISTHTYGTKGGYVDEFGTRHHFLREDFDRVTEEIDMVSLEINNSVNPSLPVYMTEWNSSFSPLDPIHDHYFNAAYILDKIRKADGQLASMSYWTFSDVFEESGPPATPFHGGFGLVNLQGIKKPSFFSYKYLNKLGETELKNSDPLSWVCKSDEGIQILLWDYSQPKQGEVSNNLFYIRDIPADRAGNVNIVLKGLEAGNYKMNVYRTGYRSNDPYADYYDMGRPSVLTDGQLFRINERNNDQPVFSGNIVVGKDGVLKHSLELHENDVYFVEIIR
jgi:xylan 1,4-beta-xylosidase